MPRIKNNDNEEIVTAVLGLFFVAFAGALLTDLNKTRRRREQEERELRELLSKSDNKDRENLLKDRVNIHGDIREAFNQLKNA